MGLKENIKSLETRIKSSDEKNLLERESLDLAVLACREAVKAQNKLLELNEEVQVSRKNLESIKSKESEVSDKLDEGTLALDLVVKDRKKEDDLLSEISLKKKKLLKKSEGLEIEIGKKEKEVIDLGIQQESATTSRDKIMKVVNKLKDEKEKLKRLVTIFAKREEELGTKDKKKVLELQCEEDEEVREQFRTSEPGKKIYFIAKKSSGAPNANVGLIE